MYLDLELHQCYNVILYWYHDPQTLLRLLTSQRSKLPNTQVIPNLLIEVYSHTQFANVQVCRPHFSIHPSHLRKETLDDCEWIHFQLLLVNVTKCPTIHS